MSLAYLGIGANLGDARNTVRAAIAQLAGLPDCQLCAVSSLYGSAPVDSSGDDYVNAVVALETTLTPSALLAAIQQIELAFGRERPYRNAPRTLDLDVLLFDAEVIDTAHLTVPHPRMLQRAFVLLPLLEIAPDIGIPGQGAAAQYLPQVANQRILRLPEA